MVSVNINIVVIERCVREKNYEKNEIIYLSHNKLFLINNEYILMIKYRPPPVTCIIHTTNVPGFQQALPPFCVSYLNRCKREPCISKQKNLSRERCNALQNISMKCNFAPDQSTPKGTTVERNKEKRKGSSMTELS